MRIESLRAMSPTWARLSVRTVRQGVAADELAVVRVFQVYDPAVAAFVPRATATYAFLQGCRAAPEALKSAMSLCNQIFRSFRPSRDGCSNEWQRRYKTTGSWPKSSRA